MPLGPFALVALLGLGPTYGNLPLHFEANHGQTDPRVKFLARSQGYTLFLTSNEAVLASASGQALRMQFAGATESPSVAGRDALPGRAHYLIGNDPKAWHTNVPMFARVEYREVYPGIDVVFYGQQGRLEYDFVLAPGADPRAVRLRFENAESLQLDAQGDILLHTQAGLVRQHKPAVYQDVNGERRRIPAEFQLRDGHEVGFLVADHDASRPLIIDPVLSYSTYLGGNDVDSSREVAVDSAGNAYVTGTTTSTNFPVSADAAQGTYGGGVSDAFVAKLNRDGSGLVYATYLGGSVAEQANAIAVDDSHQVYLTGFTSSGDFPTRNPFQPAFGGLPIDGFVTKLNADGDALIFSTYLGGAALDVGNGIAVDHAGNVYVSARTASSNLPATPGAFQTTFAGAEDAFIAKFSANGSQLRYLTYLGGVGIDIGRRLALDHSGCVYISGRTGSSDFPTTAGAAQSTFAGGAADAFVTKLNSTGSALVYSTYLGGSGLDEGSGIGLLDNGDVITAGWTDSTDLATTPGAFQPTFGGGVFDVFVTKLNERGSRIVYSTYLGGSGSEMSFFGLAIDRDGRAYITGPTGSADFPLARPLEGGEALRGVSDAFVAKLDKKGSRLDFSTYLGGSGTEGSQGITVDHSGNVYVAGTTASADFHTTEGAFQTSPGGGPNDAFVVKISRKDHHGHGHGDDDDEEDDHHHD